MSDIDFNALGQATDSTWGRASTTKTASYSVKWSLVGSDRMEASYAAIVNFASDKQFIDMKKRYEEEARSITSSLLKGVKATYKELSGETLTTKELSATDSVEIINMNIHTPRRTAYYRRKTVFEIG